MSASPRWRSPLLLMSQRVIVFEILSDEYTKRDYEQPGHIA